MITQNDYTLNLFNGEVGVILPDPDAGQELRAWFPGENGRWRKFPPPRLPAHETVYALTVHKSQGSEFDRVLLILPDRDAPVLTRELLYTGITRARKGVEIWGREAVFRAAVGRRIQRSSGLRETLWAGRE
jgi:exodeoxyribonuclease V alpha subunit